MGTQTFRSPPRGLWVLVERQHGVASRAQLLELGFSSDAIKHGVATGRLHPKWRGIYAVGRPDLDRHGRWMGAVLACGRRAALSHDSAAALWGIRAAERLGVEVSAPADVVRSRPGIEVHRRSNLFPAELTRCQGIPVTMPGATLVDIALRLSPRHLETAINATDALDLADPEALRTACERLAPRPGVAALRKALDRQSFVLTDSDLERRFLRCVRRAGLPTPRTGLRLNGFKVDFFWPDLGLVVETDGLRYHRTSAQQARDRVRDQVHTVAGLTCLRFTYAQVAYERDRVVATLRRSRTGRAARSGD